MRYAIPIAALMAAAPLAAQDARPDPYASDPVGIVADPCPAHPKPADAEGWRLWNANMMRNDWGQLCRYAADDRARAGRPVRVVFIGDSITDAWIGSDPSLFTNGIVDRGISGQTTPQMLVRFRQDVIALHPRAVHIMAGTNDIAGNTGPATMATVQGNIESMAELARAHGIRVIIASVPPAAAFQWRPGKRPAAQIVALNGWLRGYAKAKGYAYVDYHAALATPEGGMKPPFANDGVHPTPAGYAVMRPLALAAIAQTLGAQ